MQYESQGSPKMYIFLPDYDGVMVGHLPREISRLTKFILDRGVKITAEVISSHYLPLPKNEIIIGYYLTADVNHDNLVVPPVPPKRKREVAPCKSQTS